MEKVPITQEISDMLKLIEINRRQFQALIIAEDHSCSQYEMTSDRKEMIAQWVHPSIQNRNMVYLLKP